MATIGTTTTPTTQGGAATGIRVVTPVTTSEAGTMTSLSIYVDGGASGGGNLKPVIFSDSGGKPSALLAVGSPVAIGAAAPAAWVVAAISYTFANGQVLWIGSVEDNANCHTYSTASGITSYFKTGSLADYTDPSAVSMLTATADPNKTYGFFGTYTPSGGSGGGMLLSGVG
jgi:hypothetical protein